MVAGAAAAALAHLGHLERKQHLLVVAGLAVERPAAAQLVDKTAPLSVQPSGQGARPAAAAGGRRALPPLLPPLSAAGTVEPPAAAQLRAPQVTGQVRSGQVRSGRLSRHQAPAVRQKRQTPASERSAPTYSGTANTARW